MSSEILVPFALTPSGGIAATSDPAVMTQQHVDSLISTRPGERAMIPGYGVDLPAGLFGQPAAIVQQGLESDVQQAAAKYEPGVRIIAVVPNAADDPVGGVVSLNVDYVTALPGGNSAPSTTTATILTGGTVIETVN